MLYILGVLVAIAVVIAYIQGVFSLFSIIFFLGAIIAFDVLNAMIAYMISCKSDTAFNSKQLIDLARASKEDAENAELNRKSKEKALKILKEKRAQERSRINKLNADDNAQLAVMKQELAIHNSMLEELDVLSNDDLKIELIDELITILESRRANCIKEALLRYDEKRQIESRMAYEDAMNFLHDLDERSRREKEHRDNLELQSKLNNIASVEEKRLKEIERLRKDLEYQRRYGSK